MKQVYYGLLKSNVKNIKRYGQLPNECIIIRAGQVIKLKKKEFQGWQYMDYDKIILLNQSPNCWFFEAKWFEWIMTSEEYFQKKLKLLR
ncbi:MAG: hypothetical protein HQ541_03095 [Mariniphaga sp.]|nr:hypothetical protein [Mariniphaga sp.]